MLKHFKSKSKQKFKNILKIRNFKKKKLSQKEQRCAFLRLKVIKLHIFRFDTILDVLNYTINNTNFWK